MSSNKEILAQLLDTALKMTEILIQRDEKLSSFIYKQSYSPNFFYKIAEQNSTNNIQCLTHLQKCLLKTVDYPFLEEYIEFYIKAHPDSINEVSRDINVTFNTFDLARLNLNKLCSEDAQKILLKYSN